MAYVVSYARVTNATIPKDIWDEVWLSIQSWKGFLQSIPGFYSMRFAARRLENGDIRILMMTNWHEPEQLDAWHSTQWSADKLLKSFEQDAYDVTSETYEELG